jgi:hypothetical protein
MKRFTRGQAIKNYCKMSCCAGSIPDWKECPATHCFLWNFRLGRETLAKPYSFKKQRKSRVFSSKSNVVAPITTSKKALQPVSISDKIKLGSLETENVPADWINREGEKDVSI